MLADTSLPRGSDATLASVGTLFEGFERFVASPPYLVGYVRRDARFDQYLLVKQSFPTAFRSHGDKPVGGAEIRPSVSGTIQNRQLMPEQDGFGENCPHASGTNQTNKDGDDMDE